MRIAAPQLAPRSPAALLPRSRYRGGRGQHRGADRGSRHLRRGVTERCRGGRVLAVSLPGDLRILDELHPVPDCTPGAVLTAALRRATQSLAPLPVLPVPRGLADAVVMLSVRTHHAVALLRGQLRLGDQ